jgi:hypothetical protein
MLKKFNLGVVGILLAVFGFMSSVNTSAQNTKESASGQGTLLVTNSDGDLVKRQFNFNAKRQADGTVKGHAVLHNPAFEIDGKKFSAQIDISCLKIVGNTAVLGGLIRRTNDPGFMDAVYFSVQDNGEPGKGKDKISSVFLFDNNPTTTGDPQLCLNTPTDPSNPETLDLITIDSGNVQVRGGTMNP